MSRFEIEVRERLNDLVVLSLRGRCVSAMAHLLRDALESELEKKPGGLLLDGSGLEEVEGDCLYEIVMADRQLRARQGGLALFSLPNLVAQSMKQADLLDDIEVHANFVEARQALETQIRNARCAAAVSRILEGKASAQRRRRRRRVLRREGQKLTALATQILSPPES